MQRIDTSLLVQKQGNYKIARNNALLDATLLGVAGEYRSNTSRKYITLPQTEINHKFGGTEDVLVTTKYDGEGVFVFYDREENDLFCFNAPSGRVRVGLPCLEEARTKLEEKGIKKALFAAELYVHHDKSTGTPKPTVADTIHISFNGSPKEIDLLHLAIFDIIMLDGQNWRSKETHFLEVWTEMDRIAGTKGKFHRVNGNVLPEQEVSTYFKRVTAEEEEGIVVRRLNRKDITKIKPSITVDGVIIGFVESAFEGMYGIASLLIGLTTPQGTIREFVRVGSGFTDQQRIDLLKHLQPLKVDSPILKTDSDGRPITFVRPSILAEVQGESFERETFSGKPYLTQTFAWNGSAYAFKGVQDLPRLKYATFSRLREDKQLEEGGARITQIISEKEAKTAIPSNTEKPQESPSSILQRQIFTKAFKGQTSVRKFILLHTSHPTRLPYLIYFLDYSPTRKTPQALQLKGAYTHARAQDLFTQILEHNTGRGWNPQAASV